MTCRWPAREPCGRSLEPGAQGSQLRGDKGRSPLPPIFQSHARAARCEELWRKKIVTRAVTSCYGIEYDISSKLKTSIGGNWKQEQVVKYQPLDKGHHSREPGDGRRKEREVIRQS